MALTTIANIKETLSVGARPNLFSVSLLWPEGYELSGEMTVDTANLLCKTAAIPGMTIGVIEVPFRAGRRIKVPGDRTFADWTVTFISDEAHALRDSFLQWAERIKTSDYNSDTLRAGDAAAFDYTASLSVTHLKSDGKPSRTYKLAEAFPTEVGAIELSYDSTDSLSEFSVTFQYHWMTAESDVSEVDDDAILT